MKTTNKSLHSLGHIYYHASPLGERCLMSRTGTPESVVEEFSRGYRAKRYDKVYDLYSNNSEIRKNYSRTAYSSRMRNTAQRTKMEIKDSKLAGSEVREDTARVTLISTTKSIVGEWHMEEEFTLKREEGKWKIVGIAKVRQWPLKQGGTSVRGGM